MSTTAPDAVDLPSALRIATAAAQASRDLLKRGFGGLAPTRSQIGRDIKLEADVASERLIVDELRRHSDLPILSEEAGWIGEPTTTGDYWAMDPLDGSFNYSRGVPICATAVALCRGRTPLVGVIFDFLRDEIFAGGPGLGVKVNDRLLPDAELPAQILSTGLPVRADFTESGLTRYVERLAKWKKVRLIGSATLSLAWTAAGRFDGYDEGGIMWWDVAAGLALASGAGIPWTAEGESLTGPFNVRVARKGAPS